MSAYIVTLDELKAELGIPDAKDDGELLRLIEGLQGRFEDRAGRRFLRAEDTEYFDGGVTSLFVRRFPIERGSVSVWVDADQVWGDADLYTETEDYSVHVGRGRIVHLGGKWPLIVQGIKVTYTGGYVPAGEAVGEEQTPMPDGLRGIFLLQAAFEWRNRTNLGKSSMGAGGVSINLAPAALLPEVATTLEMYRRF